MTSLKNVASLSPDLSHIVKNCQLSCFNTIQHASGQIKQFCFGYIKCFLQSNWANYDWDAFYPIWFLSIVDINWMEAGVDVQGMFKTLFQSHVFACFFYMFFFEVINRKYFSKFYQYNLVFNI